MITLHVGALVDSSVDRQNAADISQELCSKCRSPGSATQTSLGPCCWSFVPKQAGNLTTCEWKNVVVYHFLRNVCLLNIIIDFLFLEQASWLSSHPNSTVKPNQSCSPYLTKNEILAVPALLFGKGLGKSYPAECRFVYLFTKAFVSEAHF